MKRVSSQAGLTVGERERERGGGIQGGMEGESFDVLHLHLTTKRRKNKLKLL